MRPEPRRKYEAGTGDAEETSQEGEKKPPAASGEITQNLGGGASVSTCTAAGSGDLETTPVCEKKRTQTGR